MTLSQSLCLAVSLYKKKTEKKYKSKLISQEKSVFQREEN
jgi:hypothetical protein